MGASAGTTRPFRFGVVAVPHAGGRAWVDSARRFADLGFGSVMMPEVTQLPSPFPSLAAAAAVSDLRVGTFVTAVPLRAPGAAAWEAHSLATLTEGRFDFGLGTGLPQTVQQGAAMLGTPELTPGQRLERITATVRALRELEAGGPRTPILIAAGGTRARALAAAEADVVTIAAGPDKSGAEVAELVADVRERAGERGPEIEFATNTFVVGDEVPAQMSSWVGGADAATLAARDATTWLPGDPSETVDVLQRRRAEIGLSYILVSEMFVDALAPVVARLSGS